MTGRQEFAWHRSRPRRLTWQTGLQLALMTSLVFTLVGATFLNIPPVRAQHQASPAFSVKFDNTFFGTQWLWADPDNLKDPAHARFTITNYTELWYSVRVFASPNTVKPIAPPALNDLVSEAVVESGLLMPADIIPVNPDLGLFQKVTLESHFTAPNQQVSIELNPFTVEAGILDAARLFLYLIDHKDVAKQAGIVVRGAIKDALKAFQSSRDLLMLVSDFLGLLKVVVQRKSPLEVLGSANAVFDDLLQISKDVSEVEKLGVALSALVGRRISLTALRIVLGILNGGKYLSDLILAFGAYLIHGSNYPTITLRSVAVTATPTRTPTPRPTPTPAPALSSYANKIVQWNGDTATPKTSWLVAGDLYRYWIPNSSTYNCLRSSGFAFGGALSSMVLNQLPDMTGSSAACGTNALDVNQRLFRGSYLRTSDGNYTLKLQLDGNLVLRGPTGAVVWANSKTSDYLVLQNGGNLVSYRWLAGGGAASTWATNTGGTGATKLAVQNGGKLVLYTGAGAAVWDSIHGKL